MRALMGMMVAAGLVGLPGLVRADSGEEARALLNRAIKAHGGAEGLAKSQISSRTGEGVVTLGGEQKFKTEVLVSLPERVRLKIDVGENHIETVIDGDKGWEKRPGGAVNPMRKQRLGELREVAYLWWLATLVPLQKDEFTLTPVREVTLEDGVFVGLKVVAQGHPDALLLFEKETGMLARIGHRTTEEGLPVKKEYLYSDYKDIDGVKIPMREITRINGKNSTDVKFDSVKLIDRVPGGAFDRP